MNAERQRVPELAGTAPNTTPSKEYVPASPGKDKETNWLPAPSAPFSLYIRCYWPKQEVIDGRCYRPRCSG